MNTDSTTPALTPEDLSVNALVVCCQCSDGKLRAVQFDKGGKQAKQVHGYIRHISGGRLKLHKEPLVLVQLDESAPTSAPPPPKRSFFPAFLSRLFSPKKSAPSAQICGSPS